MKVCVLNEDQAWHVERDGASCDHRFHEHWTATKAARELMEQGVRVARRRNDQPIPNTVVLQSSSKQSTIYWTPTVKESDGYSVLQLIPGQKKLKSA